MKLFSTAGFIACLATLGLVAADCVGLDSEEHVAEGAAYVSSSVRTHVEMRRSD